MSLVKYRNWLKSRENYLNWLQSNSTAIGLMKDAIKFEQHEHIASISTSKKMWDHLYNIHITQCQSINVYYYYQELYIKKWNKYTIILDHIRPFLNLHYYIIKASQKLKDIYLIHAMLFFLPCLTI